MRIMRRIRRRVMRRMKKKTMMMLFRTCSVIHHPCSGGTFRLLESTPPCMCERYRHQREAIFAVLSQASVFVWLGPEAKRTGSGGSSGVLREVL